RNVISTRSPIARSSASTSVSSIGSRPPPSKSTTANTIGGLGEYAMRSIVNVATVPSTSLIGAASISSTAPPSRDTRAGGRCSAPVDSSREPTNANFQSCVRPATAAEIRSGSGRRGGSTVTTRRQDKERPYGSGPPFSTCAATGRAGVYDAKASVVRNTSTSAPSTTETTAITWPVVAVSSALARSSPKCAVPVLPTAADRSSTTASCATPS